MVMAKFPAPGAVKTRLVPPLTQRAACALARAMLQDTVAACRRCARIPVWVAVEPPRAQAAMRRLLGNGVATLPQSGADFGERIANALRTCRARGFRACLVVGADHPTLPTRYIAQAIQALRRPRPLVTLGPTTDGGYYLIGLNEFTPELFEGIAWSTAAVLKDTVARARAQGIEIKRLPVWFDVDTPDDLARLQRAFARFPRRFHAAAPATAAWLAQQSSWRASHVFSHRR